MRMIKQIAFVALFLTIGTGALFAGSNIKIQQFYSVSEVHGVNVDLNTEEIEVALWNRDEFRVTVVSNNNDYPVPHLSDGILYCNTTPNSKRKCLVEIKVPESFYARAAYGGWTLSTKTGSISASKLWGETLDIKTVTGSVTLTKCEAQLADVSSDTGKVMISQCIISDMVNLSVDTGAVTFDGIAGGIIADCDTGSINISLDQMPDHDCEITNDTGSITISLPENPGFKFVFSTDTGSVYNAFTGYSGKKSGIDNYGAGYVIIRTETDTGSIRILRK